MLMSCIQVSLAFTFRPSYMRILCSVSVWIITVPTKVLMACINKLSMRRSTHFSGREDLNCSCIAPIFDVFRFSCWWYLKCYDWIEEGDVLCLRWISWVLCFGTIWQSDSDLCILNLDAWSPCALTLITCQYPCLLYGCEHQIVNWSQNLHHDQAFKESI